MASRNISISLPEEMIQQANQLATAEHRTLSELFREAFRVYSNRRSRPKSAEPVQPSPAQNSVDNRTQELVRIARELRAELEDETIESS